jgi:NTE family protein
MSTHSTPARLAAVLALATVAGFGSSTHAQDRPPVVAPPQSASAQPAQPRGDRPRIGLALGGGSARGIAHIGVLEWFEQHRIPIDYIAGTSMGGLVAGAYASGMSPAELRQLMKDTDWDLMFLADSPFRYKTFRRKQDKRAYPSQLEFGLKGGFTLPGGLNPGQQVSLLLDRIGLAYYEVDNFDDLPTPFRCVATDLKQANAVVLGRGSLAQAMRATMAIPGVFTPVNYDEWLLVDGGVLNNVPADVVKQMGADIVIAVNVGADPVEEEKAQQSLFALLGRTIDTMMTTGVRTALKSADLIVDPDLKGLNSLDWRRSDDLADRGYQAAEATASRLAGYAMGEAEYAAFAAARQAKRRTAAPAPAFVTVTGVGPREQAFIRESLADLIGRPLEHATAAEDILTVTGTDRYEYLSYRAVTQPEGTGLLVAARPKSYGPPFLAIGLELSNVDSSNFAVTASGRVTAYDWFGVGSEFRLDGAIGTRQSIMGEIYRPLGQSRFFVAPRAYFDRHPRNGYADERLVAEYRFKTFGAGLDLGFNSGRRAEVRLGIDVSDVRGRIRVGNPLLPEVSGSENFATLKVTWDGQTSPLVPSRGLYQTARLAYYFAAPDATDPVRFPSDQEFLQGEVEGSWFRRVGQGQDRLFLRYGLGTSFGSHPLLADFSLGGPLRLGAFNNDELRNANYLLGTVGYLRQTGRLPDVLGGNIFLGGWFEQGTVFDEWDDARYRSSVSLGAIAETLIGPVFGGASFDFDGRYRVYIAIGPLFR